MHVELSRTYPVPREEGFDYFKDVRTWDEWTVLTVVEPETTAWDQPGDTVRYTWNPDLPLLHQDGEAELNEIEPPELIRMTLKSRGLPDTPVECRFTPAGPGAFTLTLRTHTEPPTSFVGDALQRILWLDGLVKASMRKCLDGLDKAFATGI